MYQCSRITIERGALVFDDRLDAVSLGVKFFTDAAAQDQKKAQQQRKDELDDENLRAWFDEAGSCIDALAMGWKARPHGRAYGGIKR